MYIYRNFSIGCGFEMVGFIRNCCLKFISGRNGIESIVTLFRCSFEMNR